MPRSAHDLKSLVSSTQSYIQPRPSCSQHQRRNTPCHICGDVAKHHSQTITSSTKHTLSGYLIKSDDNKQLVQLPADSSPFWNKMYLQPRYSH